MNSFEYGWGFPKNKDARFWLNFKKCEYLPSSWKEEVKSTVAKLAATSRKQVWILLSGGIDSEVIAQEFLDQKLDFKILIVQYPNDLNEHDISYAVKWCRLNNIEFKLVSLDIRQFLTVDYLLYMKEGYITDNVFRYLQIRFLEIIEALNGFAVLGAGTFDFFFSREANVLGTKFNAGLVAPLEWCRINGVSHSPFFYLSSPELTLSYLKNPITQAALESPNAFQLGKLGYVVKAKVAEAAYPYLQRRIKQNGFEKIKPLRLAANKVLIDHFGNKNEEIFFSLNELNQQLGNEQKF